MAGLMLKALRRKRTLQRAIRGQGPFWFWTRIGRRLLFQDIHLIWYHDSPSDTSIGSKVSCFEAAVDSLAEGCVSLVISENCISVYNIL